MLLVDDEKAILSLLSDYLQTKGVRAVLAGNGAEAYRVLEERAHGGGPAFFAVVSDWMMPVMDGLGLLDRVRSGEFCGLPFVLMSGAVSREVLLGAVKRDPDAVVLKPFNIDLLWAKIQEAAKSRERRVREKALGGPKKDAAS